MNHFKVSVLTVLICSLSTGHAAKPIDLRYESSSLMLQQFLTPNKKFTSQANTFVVTKTNRDNTNVQHTRIKQTYAGIPVWGADAIIHTPHGTYKNLATQIQDKHTSMNGTVYLDIEKDLTNNLLLKVSQKNKALESAKQKYRESTNQFYNESISPYIFVSLDNKAHYIYKISFYYFDKKTKAPHHPIILIDVENLKIYESWDNIQTIQTNKVESIGGNPVMNKLYYDDKPSHLPKLNMVVNADQCHFENNHLILKRGLYSDGISGSPLGGFHFDWNKLPLVISSCHKVNGSLKIDLHDKESYEGADRTNGGYSPASDALHNIQITQQLYQQWYSTPVYSDKDGSSKKIVAILHFASRKDPNSNWNNAFFDEAQEIIALGDGDSENYPNTDLETIAHELSHGFTSQHSNLVYQHDSGGINESFSDMAAKAAEFMTDGKTTWNLGGTVTKTGKPLRYLDDPKNDGASIDHLKDFTQFLDVHFSSGLFNKAFYILATTPGWDTKKAFDVMVHANRYYWTSNICFEQGADGVVSAARQLGYNVSDVEQAFAKVGIQGKDCIRPLGNLRIPLGNIHPIDHSPICPSTSEDSPLKRDQIPCHVNQSTVLHVPIENELTELAFTNFLDQDVEVMVRYFTLCKLWPSDADQSLVLAWNSSHATKIKTDCTPLNTKNNTYLTIKVEVGKGNEKQHVLVNYN